MIANTAYNKKAEFESKAAHQLKLGFKWLRFAGTLEQQFRDYLRDQQRLSICTHVWLGVILVAGFILLDMVMLQRRQSNALQIIRIVMLLPILSVAVIATSKDLYQRIYQPVMHWLAPIFGIAMVANELLDQPYGISFLPTVVLTIIGIYLLVGLFFYSALRSGIIILGGYALASWLMKSPSEETLYYGLILFFTNVIGATASYTLERLHRTSFLETCLLTELASRDGLTGINNRRAFDEHIECIWNQAVRERAQLALLLIDIDYFKAYNDHYGHQAGDECLQTVGRFLAHSSRRPLDFTARYGGEEFAIVLYNTNHDYVTALSEVMREDLAQLAMPHAASPISSHLTISIGAACVVADSRRSRADFLRMADAALYAAKGAGRDRAVIRSDDFDAMATQTIHRVTKESLHESK